MNGQIFLRDIVSIINRLHDLTAGHINANRNEPTNESQAANEIANCVREQSYRTAITQGGIMLEAASDHLIALARAITEPVLSISPWTCTRGIMEASSLSAWLMNPSVDVTERVRRSFAFRHEGLVQQRRWASSAGLDYSRIDQRIDEVEQVALGLGYQRVVDRRGNRIGIGQQMPSMTKLVTDMLKGEEAYRLLSSIVHAHPWALQQISFQRVGDQSSSNGQSAFSLDTVQLERNISPASVLYLAHTGSYAFARALWYKSQLYGWDAYTLRTILNSIFDSLRYTNGDRFWN